LSHDGSACLLKDGRILVAIEKERLTRCKHDGGNDQAAVQYCLEAAGITVQQLTAVVQAANFEKETILPGRYRGPRCFEGLDIPIISISHHLAHAWSAAGTAPFEACTVLVIDGCGSPYDQCDDLDTFLPLPPDIYGQQNLYGEKDSYYAFSGRTLQPLYKDFSAIKPFSSERSNVIRLPTSEHSIGGLYSAVSNYCFGSMDDAGKLMGLAPYGKDTGKPPAFRLEDGRSFIAYEAFEDIFNRPREDYASFKEHFQHYADIAWWIQQETMRAVTYIVRHRLALYPHQNLALAGGVALNAVANAQLLQQQLVDNLYIQPAAGDNGLAIGCAFYGWCQLLGRQKETQPAHTFFGSSYSEEALYTALEQHHRNGGVQLQAAFVEDPAAAAAAALAGGAIIGWFREGAEFGPRALGHRSILADPRLPGIQLRINRDVKNREDFRPFAPSVRIEKVADYFVHAYESPYMILTDQLKETWKESLQGIVHVDGSCRVQTVQREGNEMYYRLLEAFEAATGIGVLLNTSFNVRGMPIVETPAEAIAVFCNSALDELYIDHYKITRWT
jgi:carbamoyltransferase